MKVHDCLKSVGHGAVVLSFGVLGALPGCGGESTPVPLAQPSDSAGRPAPSLPMGSVVVGEYLAHFSPTERKMTFTAVHPTSAGRAAQSIDALNVVSDDIPNSGPQGTVELLTNSAGTNSDCPAGHQTQTFCGNVTLSQFYTGSLSNVFVQVTSITDATGTEITDHGATNGDTSEFELDATKGLWKYTAPAATTDGVLGQSPDNAGTRDWIFSNPDDAETYIMLRVVASQSYSSYTTDFSSQAFVDACSIGTNLGTPSSATQTMPFPFTLYGNTSSTVKFNRRGMITFGSVAGTSSGVNVELPSTAAPKPALFAFWDDIAFGASSSGLCYATTGTAPNRQYVIQWKNMNFVAAADKTASLNFEAILSEGTNNIDVVYDTMTGPTGRASGDSATVGVQNAGGTVATAEFNQGNYGSGNAYAFIPVP
jgi:hypothetical protein